MLSLDRLRRGYDLVADALLDEATSEGPWTGELSSSPLSTATAIATLQLVLRQQPERASELEPLVRGGLHWLVEHQNPDGGWGDTVLSHSNISTSMLAYASFQLAECVERHDEAAGKAKQYVDQHGGFEAIRRRYGKDRTFSVPILTQCALAGLIPWQELTPLPFELGCLPHWFYRWIHLPVVSYALPALIAIGQVRHHHAPSRNPLMRFIRWLSVKPTLRKLESIQPESGGFLEATPLTSFVTMSLASMGRSDHPVARRGVEFLKDSVRPDGSWPIDTNLATWVTTLSVNALLPESLPTAQSRAITDWLLKQQHLVVHRYTNAAPGGWAWTNLSGGVPDADDTPGAILALIKLDLQNPVVASAAEAAIEWLLNLQNNDGGWPTFCRGWGALPFDRSTPDLTAHALRAFRNWLTANSANKEPRLVRRVERAVTTGFAFLARTQRPDGAWLPLWFGNQFANDDENPVYGVSRALSAYRDWNRLDEPVARRAISWLAAVQNSDGGWGGAAGTPSSTEETALAVEALLPVVDCAETCQRGLEWLLTRVESGKFREPAPIGLYFAKLWYFERLYPIIFAASALARCIEQNDHRTREPRTATDPDFLPTTANDIQ
ncbi:MAG: squalene--hopene cyclase [Candidatus Saccharimonas sp.]|nr:squalene--hopene cyclase [Planctomycetaceae bacterium]